MHTTNFANPYAALQTSVEQKLNEYITHAYIYYVICG